MTTPARTNASPHLRRLAALTAALMIGVSLAVSPILPATPVAASAPTATIAVSNGVLVGPPGTTLSASGTPNRVWIELHYDGYVDYIDIHGPGGGPVSGSFDTSQNGDATHGTLAFWNTPCAAGHVDVLDTPTFDAGGAVTETAITWTCGTTQSGKLWIASAQPIAAIAAIPGSLNFNETPAGVGATGDMTFQNLGTVSLGIGAITVGVSPQTPYGWQDFMLGTTTCTGTLAPAATCTQSVAFSPSDASYRAAAISVATTPSAAERAGIATGSGVFERATNDAIADAVPVPSLPFAWYADASGATTDRLDPVCLGGFRKTVWLHYAPAADGPVAVDTARTQYADTVLGVYAGSPPDDLSPVTCNDDVSASDLTSRVTFEAHAGTEYWIVVADATGTSVRDLVVRFSAGAPDTTINVGGWSAAYATVYPYLDGYRDTVTTTATPTEPVHVTIDVVAAASPGTVLRHVDLGIRDRAYGWVWNAKSDAGALLPDGAYLIRHHAVDGFGNAVTHDVPVAVSSKRLYAATGSTYVTGAKVAYKKHAGSGSAVTISGSSAVLKSGSGYAYVQYSVVLPSQPVYKTVKLEVTGKSSNGKTVVFYAWNGVSGAWDGIKRTGASLATYVGPSLAASSHVDGRTVYGMVLAKSTGSPIIWTVTRVTVVYAYAYLK